MDFKVSDYNQQIIRFDHDANFNNDDFYVSKCNEHIINFIDKWPQWEKNFLNISGEKYSGKSHLTNIFLNKFKGIKFEANLFKDDDLKNLKVHQNIVLENLTNEVDEKLIYSLFNIIDQDNKYLLVTSIKPIVEISFKLNDLESRTKNFILHKIQKPDDELIFALILKNLSDRQISIEKNLIHYIIKRINRSYSKIFDFIYKIDEVSLKKKKSIDLKIIKEVLGD
ncbi:DnaA/Hda family protein [Candidatus Pelagibacter sp.]|nr:DnaA/Hda family protein [Candidatus Pelagibacter sp.]